MKKIIRVTPLQRQINQVNLEEKMTASIFPSKYVDMVESQPDYVDEFDSKYVPIYPHAPCIIPPCTNRGGRNITSVLSTSYEITPPTKFSCIIDYLSITFRITDYLPGLTQLEKIDNLVLSLKDHFSGLKYYPAGKGLFGYRQSLGLTRNDLGCGLIGFDGNNDTCYVSFSGQGCVGVDMWALRKVYESLPGCKITRVDMAHDDLEGNVGVQQYKQMYQGGAFDTQGSPSARFIDDMGTGKGCTLYIGKKVNGKEACIYEKGRQLGQGESPWVRIEGRITAVDRVIPFDVLTQPADYLAALYPPFAYLSASHRLIEIVDKAATIALDRLVEYAGIAYGKLINFLIESGETETKIIAKLRRPGVPKRLQVTESAYANLCPF